MAVEVEVITGETNVEELIERLPVAARVFVRRRMGCVGCDIARFESLADVARIYQQPLAELLEEIRSIRSQGFFQARA